MLPVFQYMISYALVLIMIFGLLNFLTNGFITTFMKVKASRGQKLLVKVRGHIHDYFRVGKVQDGFLIYEDLNKTNRRLSLTSLTPEDKKNGKQLPTNPVYRCINVYWVDVDEEKNCVVAKDFSNVSGFDAVKWEYIYEQTLHKPNPNDEAIMLRNILIVVIISAVLILAVLITNIAQHGSILQAVQTTGSVIGGNV